MASLRSKWTFNKTLKYMYKYIRKHDMEAPGEREKLENYVLKMVEKNPGILTVQDEDGKNLGMHACEFSLPKVAIRALQDEDAAVQQDDNGLNIGMYAAGRNYEDIVLLALDNLEASTQQTKWHPFTSTRSEYNLGMYAADEGLKKATLKALQNPVAIQQLDGNGETIFDKAKRKGLLSEDVDEYEYQPGEPVEEIEEDIPQAISDLHEDIFGTTKDGDLKASLSKESELSDKSEKTDNLSQSDKNIESKHELDDEKVERKASKEKKTVISDIYDDIFGN